MVGTAAEYTYADGKIVRGESILGTLDVDIEMLSAAKFAVLVNHDDAEREFAYTSGGDASLAKAQELGWTVISMKNDWTTVF